MDDSDRQVEQVLATVEAVWAAYEASSPEYFDFFTEDASVFPLSRPLRLQGREAYRRYFGRQFSLGKRASQILHPEVRLLGEGALVTYHHRIRTDFKSLDNRTTLLLVPDGGRLKIAHMHMSPLNSPQTSTPGGLVEEVTLVEPPAAPSR
jgi:ketosteroid isomerase-like protein